MPLVEQLKLKAKKLAISLLVATPVAALFVPWEIREVADEPGQWRIVRCRPVVPWTHTPNAGDVPEAQQYPLVRVSRWLLLGPRSSSMQGRLPARPAQ